MKAKGLIKILISALMLAIVFNHVKLETLMATFRDLPWGVAVCVILAYTAGQLISATKWWLITRYAGIEVSLGTAMRAYYIGMFVNCFGFGIVGGDLTRALLLTGGKGTRATAFGTVIADRAHGLGVLAAIGIISTILLTAGDSLSEWVYLLVVIAAGVVACWLYGPPLLLAIIPKGTRIHAKIELLLAAFPRRPLPLLIITLLSATFHLLQISVHKVMAMGVGAALSWKMLFMTVPFVNILSSLPISWNGLGVREAGYKYFLWPQVLSSEQIVTFGAMWLLAVTLNSAVGGLIAWITKEFSIAKAEQAQAKAESALLCS